MRIVTTTFLLIFSAAVASAQNTAPKADSEHSTGRTLSPDTKGQAQPQGPTGPINTVSGGAPAESPQGQTPPGMQARAGRFIQDDR